MSTHRRRVRVHPRRLEGLFESEAKLLEEVTDHCDGFPFGTVSMPPDEPLRSAEEERRRGDSWRVTAIFWRFKWGVEKGMPTYNGRLSHRWLTCPCVYDWIVAELRKNPGATNDELANRFPEPEDNWSIFSGYDDEKERPIFIDGCPDHSNSRVQRSSFNRYITRARKAPGISKK